MLDEERPLFIKELIRQVHSELYNSRNERESAGERPIFAVESLVLEVNFVAEHSKDVKGGIDFQIITVGGVNLGRSKTYHEQQVHKIILNLTAIEDYQLQDWDDPSGRFRPRPRP
jgi:hypothetical protein